MGLFVRELPPQTFNQNVLIDRIDVEKNDEGNQAENGFREFDLEERLSSLQQRGESQRDDSKCKKQNNENRKTWNQGTG